MRSIQYSLIVAVGVGVASGCAPANMKESPPVKIKVTPEGGSTKHTARKFGAPATYTGRLPCADCPGIRLTVTLLPDSTYRLRQVYEERPAVYHQVGRWSVDEKGTRLILVSGASPAQRFQIVGLDSLRLLDSEGNPIKSPANHGLGRLAQVGANAALEQAYGEARAEPGAPALVTVRGHFEERPAAEGDKQIEYVVVDSVGQVRAGAACEGPTSKASLTNTYWKLLEVAGQAARVANNVAEPHLLLHPAEQQADGSTGCNQFHGPYQQTGDSLHIGPLASTLSACLDPDMNGQEAAFLDALARTQRYHVSGDTLTVSGESGLLARFVAVYMK
jgi:copper homeostasis protein (lipoprotein)